MTKLECSAKMCIRDRPETVRISRKPVLGLFAFCICRFICIFICIFKVQISLRSEKSMLECIKRQNFGGIVLRISVKNGESWTQTDALWMALSIDRQLRTQKDHPVILSFAGGGGKTSYIRRLAWEGRERGLKVLVMTTTHMAEPKHFAVFKRDLEMVRSMLAKESIAVAGRPVKAVSYTHLDAGKGCLGILGPSGCGKSMTLKSIAGIITPDSGRIDMCIRDR